MWRKINNDIEALHIQFDGDIRAWTEGYVSRGGRVHCARGCSTCCNLAVNAVFTEAVVIAGILPEPMIARVRGHARRLLESSRSQPNLLSYLRMYRSTMGSCPLLDEDGTCSIYDFRPISCRSLLSTRESLYCGLDFSALSREEKESFIAGLDLTAVSFPMHYAANPRDRGQELERIAARGMASALGFSLYGNLPFLIWLEREYHLSRVAIEGFEAVIRLLEREGLANPFLVTLDKGDANGDPP